MEVTRSTPLVTPGRLEAFSDGVLAIIITIMVLEIRAPEGHELVDWLPLIPVVLAYLFSFVFIAIYWNNHHHLLRAARTITPSVMWSNMALLFFLSLIPVATAWVGEEENYLQTWPIVLYASLSLLSGLAYLVLSVTIVRANPEVESIVAFTRSRKGTISEVLYVSAIVVAFIAPPVSLVIMVITSSLWFIPDRTLERA